MLKHQLKVMKNNKNIFQNLLNLKKKDIKNFLIFNKNIKAYETLLNKLKNLNKIIKI